MSHISTKMRRYETTSRIFLILSVVSFALAAPVSVQGIQEMHVDIADLTEGGRGASQKRMYYPWDEGPTNWVDGKSEPPGASSPDIMENWFHWFHPSPPPPHAITELAPGSSSAPAAPLWWGTQQPHPGDLSESDLWKQWLLEKPNSPSLPMSEANPSPTVLSESTSPGTPALPESTPPETPPPPESTPPQTPPSPESTPPETPPPPESTPPETPPLPWGTPPETPPLPWGTPPKTPPLPWGTPPETPPLPWGTPPETPVPPWDTPPETPAPPWGTPPETPAPPWSTPPETPAPPPGPPPETPAPPSGPPPETPGPSSPPNPELQHPAVYQSESETESESFLDKLLKGRIRRRISGSAAVHAVQRELQGSTVDPTTSMVSNFAKNLDTPGTFASSGGRP